MWSISCSTNLGAIELHCPSLVILDRAMPRLSPSAVSSTPICAQTAGTVFFLHAEGMLIHRLHTECHPGRPKLLMC